MFDWKSGGEWKRVFRYYQAGVVNTLFGFGIFSGFVAAGVNVFYAQIISHAVGATFNYATYSRYTFADRMPSKIKFALSYLINYLLSVMFLFVITRLVNSPYVSGLTATIIVSLINYFVLKNVVFRAEERQC